MTKYLLTLSRGVLWALFAAVVATALWALFTATLAPLVSGEAPHALARFWTTRVKLAVYFGGFIALLAVLPYALLLAIWLKVRSRVPSLEQTPLRVALTSFILTLPVTLVVFGSYAAPTHGLGPFWGSAFAALPWVLLSAWGGILLPRLLVPALRFKEHAVAA